MCNALILRNTLEWSQQQMGEYLGCNQSTVFRIEGGQPPRDAVNRLLQRLEALIDEGSAKPKMLVSDVIALSIGRGPLVGVPSFQAATEEAR